MIHSGLRIAAPISRCQRTESRILGCLVALAVSLTVSLTLMSAAFASSPRTGDTYRLAPGDRIAVTILGQRELSGDMTIDAAGDISLPFVGPVRVADLTVSGCQQLIHDKFADGFLKDPVVNVRISELRPVYVLGDVRAPGSYAFRYGSTVKSAVALAGGFGAAGPIESVAVSEFLMADERVRQLTFEQAALRVRQARLEAQRDGRDSFSPPDVPRGKQFARLAANEEATLRSETAIVKAEIDLLNSQRPRIQKEINAIKAQISVATKRLEFLRGETKRSAGLVERGLGVRSAEIQLKLQEGNEEADLWRLSGQLSRLQMDLGNLDIRIQEVKGGTEKQALAELQKVQEHLAELNATLPSAREIRDVKLQQAENAATLGADHSYNVTRNRDGRVAVMQATETTLLEPGDVVEVKKALPSRLLALPVPAG